MAEHRTDVPEDLAGAGLAEPSLAHLSDAAAESLIVAYVRSDEDWPRKCSWGLRGLNASEATRLAVSMAGADRHAPRAPQLSDAAWAVLDVMPDEPPQCPKCGRIHDQYTPCLPGKVKHAG
jgi:hypothetical protein